jgi:hypothetical protein
MVIVFGRDFMLIKCSEANQKFIGAMFDLSNSHYQVVGRKTKMETSLFL